MSEYVAPTPVKGLINCPSCDWNVDASLTERYNVECKECGYKFCSICRGCCHYRIDCDEISVCMEEWANWCTIVRNKDEISDEKRNEELKYKLQQLKKQELYKQDNCRYCPKCSRLVKEVPGCDLMICGTKNDNGLLQNGCGYSFNTKEAQVYVSKLANGLIHKKYEAEHHLFKCNFCSKDIFGARFECINCECVNYCEKCEIKATHSHDHKHIFRVIYKGNERPTLNINMILNRCLIQ